MFRPGVFFFLFISTQIIGAISALTWKTFDISSLIVEESKKVSYRDINGNTKKLETILKENGANNIKIRLWVTSENNDLEILGDRIETDLLLLKVGSIPRTEYTTWHMVWRWGWGQRRLGCRSVWTYIIQIRGRIQDIKQHPQRGRAWILIK